MTNDDVDLVRAILAEHEAMKRDRQSFEQQWNDLIEIMLPRYQKFNAGWTEPGLKRTQKIFDATPGLAQRHLSASMESMITPRTQIYQRLMAADPRTKQSDNVKAYLDATNDLLFSVRYKWRAGFPTQIGEFYSNACAFGAGGLMVEDTGNRRSPIRYRHIRLAQLYYSEDAGGLVDKAHMTWWLTARQAAQRWGVNALPLSIRNAVERAPETKFPFIHAVRPRMERDTRRLDGRNMAWQSVWICLNGNDILEHGGFRTFPVAIGRLAVADGSQYAYSPAMDALPDIKMLNDMERTNIRGAQKAVDPPLLLAEDGALEGFNLKSGALNYGGLDGQGNQMVRPLELGKNVPLGRDFADQKREAINTAFYVTLFQILVDNPQMTATEVLQRQQEKGFLLAPTMGRLQAETLGCMTERELDIMASYDGLLPDMPAELIDQEGEIDVEYDSPLNRAMRSEDAVNTQRWLELIAPLAQTDPRVARVPNSPEIARELATTLGVPQRFLNSREDAQAAMEQDAAQQQAAQILQAAPIAAGAAKDLSEANSNLQQAPL